MPAETRALDSIARELLAPLLDGTALPAGWRVHSWDAEQGICLTLVDGETTILLELEERTETRDCYARTARFNACTRRKFDDRPFSDADRAMIDAVLAVVRAREGALPAGPRPAAERPVVVREITVERLLMPEGRDQYYINPYVGCMIACPFCYVIDRADFSRRLDDQPALPWGRYLDVKVNAAEVLRREVAGLAGGVVRMSPILTDPYQPAERRYRITRQILEVLADTPLAPVVLTRAPRILDDLDLLRRFPRLLVGFSIPTDDDAMRAIFEPSADPIDERLAALAALHAAGVRTFAVIQPVLPMNVDRLVEQIAPHVHAVRLDRMYFGERIRAAYTAHGLERFATDAWAEDTLHRLAAAFTARGVRVDTLDDLSRLLD